jgi:hypothetical protein
MVVHRNKKQALYPVPQILVDWLDEEFGRAAHFQRVDPILHPPIISKLRKGEIPVTFEYAFRLERAQMASDAPFKAVDIMTFEQDRQLYRYATGQEAAPVVPKWVRQYPSKAKDAARAEA